MEELNYVVKTPVFEGPLDLLLDLITKRKLFISDVSLAAVTDDFIRYIDDPELQQAEYGAGHMGEMAEFILIASTLMLIKSRSLLPSLELTEEEEVSVKDLENRLVVYARVKELAAILGKHFGRRIIFEKLPAKNPLAVFSPDSKTDTKNLYQALFQVLESLPKIEVVPKVMVKKMITLEETIEKLAGRITQAVKMNFKDFYGKDLNAKGKLTYEKKVSIIVGFLALLELVRRGAVRASQEGDEIEIETREVGVPTYG